MNYEVFSYPSCEKCAEVKTLLGERGIEFEEYLLNSPEGVKRIRGYYVKMKEVVEIERDEHGIVVPLIVISEDGNIRQVVQDKEGLLKCLSEV